VNPESGGRRLAGAAVAKPAIAQSMPELNWRLTASWPKSLDTLFGACTTIAKYVSEATDGKFQIQTFAGGEIVPALQALDAVQNGTVELAHTAMYYFIGKDPTWALFCAYRSPQRAPAECLVLCRRGPEADRRIRRQVQLQGAARGQHRHADGGWFRKEINSVDDLNGLKSASAAGGKTIAKLAAYRSRSPAGDIYPALEKAPSTPPSGLAPTTTRSSLLQDREVLLLPGLVGRRHHQPSAGQPRQVERPAEELQAVLETAAAYANVEEQARYDALNPQALKRSWRRHDPASVQPAHHGACLKLRTR